MKTGTGGERRRGLGLMAVFMLLLFGFSSLLYESLGVYIGRADAAIPPKAFAAVFDSKNGAVPGGLGGSGVAGLAGKPGKPGTGAGFEGPGKGTGAGTGGVPDAGFAGAAYDPFAGTSASPGQETAGLTTPGGSSDDEPGGLTNPDSGTNPQLAASSPRGGFGPGGAGLSDFIGGSRGGGGIGQTPDPTSPLPEPEEWLLLITGFAVALFALWRRRPALGFAH